MKGKIYESARQRCLTGSGRRTCSPINVQKQKLRASAGCHKLFEATGEDLPFFEDLPIFEDFVGFKGYKDWGLRTLEWGMRTQKAWSCRHDICQNFYATTVLGARILHKKRVNRDITQFATKERKCFKWPNSRQKSVINTALMHQNNM